MVATSLLGTSDTTAAMVTEVSSALAKSSVRLVNGCTLGKKWPSGRALLKREQPREQQEADRPAATLA